MVANIILCNIFKKSTLSTYIFPVKIVIMRNIDNKIMKNVNNFFFSSIWTITIDDFDVLFDFSTIKEESCNTVFNKIRKNCIHVACKWNK